GSHGPAGARRRAPPGAPPHAMPAPCQHVRSSAPLDAKKLPPAPKNLLTTCWHCANMALTTHTHKEAGIHEETSVHASRAGRGRGGTRRRGRRLGCVLHYLQGRCRNVVRPYVCKRRGSYQRYPPSESPSHSREGDSGPKLRSWHRTLTDRRLTHMFLIEWWLKEWREKSTFEKILDVVGAIWFIAFGIILPIIAAIDLAYLLWYK